MTPESLDGVDRWIRTQRIGFVAYCLSVQGTDVPAELLVREVQEAREINGEAFFRSLPATTAQLLLAIPKGGLNQALRKERQLWERTWNELHEQPGRSRFTAYNAARVLGYQYLHGTGGVPTLLQLGMALQKDNPAQRAHWRDVIAAMRDNEQLHAAVAQLRDTGSNTEDRLGAVVRMRGLLNRAPGWYLVENALLHQLFAWPLVVQRYGDDPRSVYGATSFPVAIDISHCGVSAVTLEVDGANDIEVSGWKESLKRAVDAAKGMWLGRHKNFGPVCEATATASVAFDFTVVTRIARGVFGKTLRLKDRSLEAYFAQVVLRRFLGHPPFFTSALTGLIGDREADPPVNAGPAQARVAGSRGTNRSSDARTRPKGFQRPPSDYPFLWADYVPEKLRHVFRSHSFDGFILPRRKGDDYKLNGPTLEELNAVFARERHEQSCSVRYVSTLARAADAVQLPGWRGKRYVRCPDVAWAVRRLLAERKRGVSHAPSAGATRCLELLRHNTGAVLDLGEESTPAIAAADVASALVSVPGGLTWAFVRAVDDEVDERFWSVIWRATGAPAKGFEAVQYAPTPSVAAAKIAEALNTFKPCVECPGFKTPDIIVVVGAEKLGANEAEGGPPFRRPLSFSQVLAAFRTGSVPLRPVPSKPLQDHLRKTRLIVLHGDPGLMPRSNALPVSDREHRILTRLSIFRFGFTHQMAVTVLRDLVRGPEIDALLANLCARQFLRKVLGEFYVASLPPRVPDSNTPGLAALHYRVGLAYCPYVGPRDGGGVAHDRSTEPDCIHEADHHFSRALELAAAQELDPETHACARNARDRLRRWIDQRSWHAIPAGKSENPKDDLAIGRAYLDRWDADGVPVHHTRLSQIAAATVDYLRSGAPREERGELRGRATALFERALEACEGVRQDTDRVRLGVLTRFEAHLRECASDECDRLRARALIEEATSLLIRGTNGSGVSGEWYESAGDTSDDHEVAERFYSLGVRWARRWRQLWVKRVGAAVLMGQPDTDIQRHLHDLEASNDAEREAELWNIFQSARRGYRGQRRKDGPVLDRWRAGIEACRNHLENWDLDYRIEREISSLLTGFMEEVDFPAAANPGHPPPIPR